MSEQGQEKKQKKFWFPDEEQEEFGEPVQMQVIKKKYLPQVLSQILPFDCENETQIFYRQSKKVGTKSPLMLNHGWRVAEITPEKESLALFCFSLFQAQLQVPLHFYFLRQATSSRGESLRHYSKFLWMEASIMITGVTRNQFQENIEYSYYTFAREQLIPIFTNFVQENIVWSKMVAQNYNESAVIDKFQEEVINVIRQRFYNFKIGEDYSLNKEYEKQKKMKKQVGLE